MKTPRTTTTPTTTTHSLSLVTMLVRGCGNQVKTLYGIFQLSNREACSDGTTPSRNLCRLSCSSESDL